MNSFEFNNTFYIQTYGTAMGTRMGPSYANLFLAKFETDALSHAPQQPHTWWRFIDDIFMIWTHRRRVTHFYYLPQQYSSHYQIHFIPFSNIYFGLFWTSRSHSTSLAKLRPISILCRQTNTSTLYNHRATLYIKNEPFHSVSLSNYDAYALPTKASHYTPMNSSNTLTIVDTTSLFSKRKSNEFTQSQ